MPAVRATTPCGAGPATIRWKAALAKTVEECQEIYDACAEDALADTEKSEGPNLFDLFEEIIAVCKAGEGEFQDCDLPASQVEACLADQVTAKNATLDSLNCETVVGLTAQEFKERHEKQVEDLDAKAKTRSRMHYKMAELQGQRIGEGTWPVMFDPDGFMAEGPGWNIFLVNDGTIYTPEPRNILQGVSRGTVFELAQQALASHAIQLASEGRISIHNRRRFVMAS